MYTRNVVHTTTLKNLDAGVLHSQINAIHKEYNFSNSR